MMIENYVNFEQAKLLKDYGFPQDFSLPHVYLADSITKTELSDTEKFPIRCPLSLVQNWIRKELKLEIEVEKVDYYYYKYKVVYSYNLSDGQCMIGRIGSYCNDYTTYEEALSAGIDKALEIYE